MIERLNPVQLAFSRDTFVIFVCTPDHVVKLARTHAVASRSGSDSAERDPAIEAENKRTARF
jgi:hypothetical protein